MIVGATNQLIAPMQVCPACVSRGDLRKPKVYAHISTETVACRECGQKSSMQLARGKALDKWLAESEWSKDNAANR